MSEISEHEKLYLPSYWSKRFPADEILIKYVEILTKSSEDARKNVPNELNVAYGSREKAKFDVYGIDLPKDSPIFIFIHGGYWQEEIITKDISSFMAQPLHNNKCKLIVIGYTLCPTVTMEELVQEIHLAIKACLVYAQENGSRKIAIGGHSAGAHLAMTVFPDFFNGLPENQQKLIKSVFLVSGVYDLKPLLTTTINDPLKLTDDLAQKLSPQFQDYKSLGDKATKFLVCVGENDSAAFVEQSQAFYELLKRQRLDCSLNVIQEVDHFDITEKLDDENFELTQMIIKELV